MLLNGEETDVSRKVPAVLITREVTQVPHRVMMYLPKPLSHGGEAKRFGGWNEVLFCVVVGTGCNYTSPPLRGVSCKI